MPEHNEQDALEQSIRVLHATLSEQFDEPWRIAIADNASTDGTALIAAHLAAELPEVAVFRTVEKGRGRALKSAWLASTAEVIAYVDVDLSTDLRALPPLVAPLLSGHSDVAIGPKPMAERGSAVHDDTQQKVRLAIAENQRRCAASARSPLPPASMGAP